MLIIIMTFFIFSLNLSTLHLQIFAVCYKSFGRLLFAANNIFFAANGLKNTFIK